MKKVLFVATVVKTHIMEFHLPYLKALKEAGWETAVAARNDYENPADCIIPYCDNYYNIRFNRNPFSPENIAAYRQLKKLIKSNHYDVIHCHTPVVGVLARLAAVKARKEGTRVFYTAHGFHFFTGAPAVNWLVYYPVERFLSRFTDVLFTINKEDYSRALKFHAKETVYVPGVGIDIEKFRNTFVDRNAKRAEIGVPDGVFLILSVGELNKNKNHELIIRALNELNDTRIHYALAGSGELLDYLKGLAASLGVEGQVHFLGYRTDVARLYKAADVLVHPSLREGLPVAVMEALASGLPVIATNIRGSADLIEDGVNGISVENNANDFKSAILDIYSHKVELNPSSDFLNQFDISSALRIVTKYY